MADDGGETDGLKEKPRNLLTIPQELRDQILREALQKYGTVLFVEQYCHGEDDAHDGPSKGSRGVRKCYYSLVLSCKQLYKESIPIFFKNNAFELWAHDSEFVLSNRCCRLTSSLNFNVVFEIGSLVGFLPAWIEIRGAKVAVTVEGKTWSISEDGTEEVKGSARHEYYANDMYDRLQPSLNILRGILQAGQGIGFETFKSLQRKMDGLS